MRKKEYVVYCFEVHPITPGNDILISQLTELGFEGYEETEVGVEAYILKSLTNKNLLKKVPLLKSVDFNINYTTKQLEEVNWNEEWEKSFHPILVDNCCLVRAAFHKSIDVPYEIIIEPKMSFGTGHHETTWLMIQFILENSFEDKEVLDMGCGTGILSILAEKRGASHIDAIDIDEWSFENCKENLLKNKCKSIDPQLGSVGLLSLKKYDIILANINKNTLLTDLKHYSKSLKNSGRIYLSGFYSEDISEIEEVCFVLGLKLHVTKIKNNWAALKFARRIKV